MDSILRTALDWFIDETRSRRGLAEIHHALAELRTRIGTLPSRLFFLESPDQPYALSDVLVALGKAAVDWQADPDRAVERKLLAPMVEEVLQRALDLRGLIAATLDAADGAQLPKLPMGEVRRTMEGRGETLPDRL